jgi:hypothetical protein
VDFVDVPNVIYVRNQQMESIGAQINNCVSTNSVHLPRDLV